MKSTHRIARSVAVAAVSTGCFFLFAGMARAHCDTSSGPVIPEAKAALESGDVTPLLKWVTAGHEAEIKAAFAKTIAVRGASPEVAELADHYFLETLVRVHRAGEGAPYTGISDEPVEPIVAMADQALSDGSADEMIAALSAHMSEAVREKFARAAETKKHKDDSVADGRAYVEAYVTYMHYVEGLHAAILSAGGHQHEGVSKAEAPVAEKHEH